MSKKKKKAKVVEALPDLAPVRDMTGTACASCLAEPDEAAGMVAHGWHAVGTSRGRYIMIADDEAVASYKQRGKGDD